jgi:peptide/nickel transport system substrate-binding protein
MIDDYIGSGPFKFNKAEWVPGAKAVFEKFADYQPRPEPNSWLSGGKRVHFDRVEWLVMDPATAAAALQNGEVDWVETPLNDIVPLLKRNAEITVDIGDPFGNIGAFRINHLQPPFNDVRVRRAILMTLDQNEYMQAIFGDDTNIWKQQLGFFTRGAPLYTEAGADLLKGKRDFEGAKKLIAEAGATGAKVTLLVPSDVPITKAMGDVSQSLLTKLGFNVDYVAADWGTVGARRAKKDPPSQGGWNVFHTWHAGADCVNPASYTALDAGGDKAWFGWPSSQKVEDGIAAWYAAPDKTAEKKAIDDIDIASFENVTFVPTGFFQIYQAWRKTVSGVVKAPFPVFWGVTKA